MPIHRWLRSWREPRNRGRWTLTFIPRALDGMGLKEALPVIARELLRAADADRAGVWLSPETPSDWTGIALDVHRATPRTEWTSVNPESPWFRRVLSADAPVVTDLVEESDLCAGLLRPMRTAVGFPLAVGGEVFGLILVGYAVTRARQEMGVLRPLIEEAALVLAFCRAQERARTAPRKLPAGFSQTEKLAALGQIVSGIAHELNNPLTSIMGYAQLLLSRTAPGGRDEDLRRVYQEAERARRIVQNLLLFARESRPERRPLDLNEIVERTLALRSYELKVENISVETALAEDLSPVEGDAHQLQQVVLNLLVNAEQSILQSRPEEPELRSGGRMLVRTRHVGNGRLALEISDNGPGVAPGVAARIFDPFFTTKPLGQGTGLGLSIAFGIVQEHGGEIYLRPERPHGFSSGASFVVELPSSPVAAAPRFAPFVPGVRKEPPGENPVPGARVLVVEDELTVAQLVSDVLAEEGHDVEYVLDSREGLRRALREPFDLLICDLRMPGLDGRAFYQALVRAGSPAQHRIAFITGDTLGARTLEFLQSHQLPYLGKPFLVEELKAVVHHLLQLPREPRPAAESSESQTVASRHAARRESVRKT